MTPRLPGDVPLLERRRRMVRADHALAQAAVALRQGRHAAARRTAFAPALPSGPALARAAVLDRLATAERVRPSALLPLCRLAAFTLGAAAALAGPAVAAAGQDAMEDALDDMMAQQANELDAADPIRAAIAAVRPDSLQPRPDHPGLPAALAAEAVKLWCRAAMAASARL